ncbi:hypothetical protein ACH5RR_041046 [Cinchona calisaya]|uniref:Transposase-associated domain-containing protein n=1 Tax=Cinchona calisaya TaxID=153742 RepID=A0ABD2XSV4_9GENT
MDKSWMRIADRRSRDYLKGVNDFIEFAKQNMGDERMIHCPCKKCMNSSRGTLREVKSHLKHPGIDKSYTFWVHHGECLDDDDDIDDDLENDVAVDNIDEDNNDDVHQMLDDMQRSTFIEIGHGGSESTLEIDKTKEDNLARFDKLLKDAERELYTGCKLSLLSSLLKLLHVKVLNKWSNKSWNMLVEVLQEILPEGILVVLKEVFEIELVLKVRPFAKTDYITLKEEEYNLMHWYVLNNCEELKPYLDEHGKELIAQNPTLKPEDIATVQKKAFPSWLGK